MWVRQSELGQVQSLCLALVQSLSVAVAHCRRVSSAVWSSAAVSYVPAIAGQHQIHYILHITDSLILLQLINEMECITLLAAANLLTYYH